MSIPEKIYIQRDSDFCDEFSETWDKNRIFEDDIEYIRADLVQDWIPIINYDYIKCETVDIWDSNIGYRVAGVRFKVNAWDGDEFYYLPDYSKNFTHFMPLPKPPRVES